MHAKYIEGGRGWSNQMPCLDRVLYSLMRNVDFLLQEAGGV